MYVMGREERDRELGAFLSVFRQPSFVLGGRELEACQQAGSVAMRQRHPSKRTL